MSDRCLKPEELADLVGLPLGDPRRAHRDECPRCQALEQSFAAFMDPADVPEEADLADARLRLSEALGDEIGAGSRGEVVRPAPTFWTPFRV